MEIIKLNQLGYRPGDPKKVVIPESFSAFKIIRTGDNTVLFCGNAGEPSFCAASHETVRIADFSAFTQPGEYRLVPDTSLQGSEIPEQIPETSPQTADAVRSFPFIINDNPYKGLRKAILDFFHYQKCGIDLDIGLWSHSACHTTPAFIIDTDGNKTGNIKDVSGGWHDAGDYGRYVAPAAQTAAQLLLAYELSPAPDNDVLDVTWFEIEWMLKMQDESSGGVYHKVSCNNFNALNQMPDEEFGELLLCPVSAAATADFAAVTAMASRFYPEKKDMLLNAAIHAWQWCIKNPEAPGFKNPPGINTGEYGDYSSKDERFWAACELFCVTGDESYHNYIKSAELSTGLGWSRMGTFGLTAYLLHADDKADEDLILRMKNELFGAAAEILEKCKADPYGISLGTVYRWGSNLNIGNNAMTLLLAEHFFGDKEYRKAAMEHVNYLLGKNALNQCYISGFGSNPMKNPHHRPSVAAGIAVPGMVSGGPNGNTKADVVLNNHCAGFPPMKCYIDHAGSYSSNEIAIYWNSPVYFVLSYLGL